VAVNIIADGANLDGAALKIEFGAALGYYGETSNASIGGSLAGELRGWLGL
jgi:hypothetical protein